MEPEANLSTKSPLEIKKQNLNLKTKHEIRFAQTKKINKNYEETLKRCSYYDLMFNYSSLLLVSCKKFKI